MKSGLLNKITNIFLSFFNSRNKFEYYYNEGVNCFNSKNIEKALEFFLLALNCSNIKPVVFYNIARAYQKLGNVEAAENYYTKYLELQPMDYDGLFNSGLLAYNKKDYEKARGHFENCAKIKIEIELARLLTLTYINQGKLDRAISFSDKIYAINKNIYYIVAKSIESKNEISNNTILIDTAINMYKKLLSDDSENFDVLYSLSESYAKKGEWANCICYGNKALDIDPSSYLANLQIGLAYYCAENFDKAIKYYEAALALNKDDYRIYSNLGYAYEKLNNIVKSIFYFNKLLEKFPEAPNRTEIARHLSMMMNGKI